MAKSKTAVVWEKHAEISRRALEEVAAMAKEEFPRGTSVRWIRAHAADNKPVYLEGVVQGVSEWRVRVKSSTGVIHQVSFESIEMLSQTEGEK